MTWMRAVSYKNMVGKPAWFVLLDYSENSNRDMTNPSVF
jgi:hypothetical protein